MVYSDWLEDGTIAIGEKTVTILDEPRSSYQQPQTVVPEETGAVHGRSVRCMSVTHRKLLDYVESRR